MCDFSLQLCFWVTDFLTGKRNWTEAVPVDPTVFRYLPSYHSHSSVVHYIKKENGGGFWHLRTDAEAALMLPEVRMAESCHTQRGSFASRGTSDGQVLNADSRRRLQRAISRWIV